MTRTDLITQVAEKSSLTQKEGAAAVDATLAAITEVLAARDNLTLSGFGTFTVSGRTAREANNPRTGEKIAVPACRAVKFKPGKALRDSVN
jgi:DNA-binding protein HU-beta